LETRAAFVLRVKQLNLLELFFPEEEGGTILCKVGNHLPFDKT
jgi:hypothetical protein